MNRQMLNVNGATIFYRLQGSGPIMLIIQGGAGDADLTQDMVNRLKDFYTVVTYDRRGLTRSKIQGKSLIELDVHANDVHDIIDALGGSPVLVFSTSIGAIIALRALELFPTDINVLIAHEPPVPAVLSESEYAGAEADLDTLQTVYKDQGFEPALKFLAGFLGINPADREPTATTLQITPEFIANMNFYFKYDIAAGRSYRPDLKLLSKLQKSKLIFGAGERSGQLWPHQCAKLFAAKLGQPFELFPGGHNGPTARPEAFTRKLIELLNHSNNI